MLRSNFPCDRCKHFQPPAKPPIHPTYGRCQMYGIIEMTGGRITYDYALYTYHNYCLGRSFEAAAPMPVAPSEKDRDRS